MRNQTQNPLVGLPARALSLYSALEVFRSTYASLSEPMWFRAPRRDARLQEIGFSKSDIDTALGELIQANLLQIREQQNTRWYRLK